MQMFHKCCAGLAVHKKTVYACAISTDERGAKKQEVCSFGTFTADLLKLADWLRERGATHVAMEATGVFRRPVWAVLEGQFELLLVNPQHIKAVPGRKTDARECEWIADLLHGLLRGGFVPPREIQDLRDLTRYGAELTQARNKVDNRIQKLLEQCNIKLSSVASDTLGLSGQLMLGAVIRGEDDPAQLAELANGKLRDKIPQLRLALVGRVRDHHGFLLKEYLEEWKTLGDRNKRVEQDIDGRILPFEHAIALWKGLPGVDHTTACNLVAEVGVNMSQFPSGARPASWLASVPATTRAPGNACRVPCATATNGCAERCVRDAWAVTRKKDCYLAAQFARVAARRGSWRAIMAVAHTILVIGYAMLKTGRCYHELGGTYLSKSTKISSRSTSLSDWRDSGWLWQ